jgi:hypothetical protein
MAGQAAGCSEGSAALHAVLDFDPAWKQPL